MTKLLIARPGHVYLATYDSLANKFAIIHDLAIPGCPSWLALDKARSLVYIVDEDSSHFHRFHLDPSSPEMPFTQKLTVDTASPGAVHLAFSHDKKRLLSAAFGSSKIDVWDVSDGVKFQRLVEKTIVSDGPTGPVSHIQDAPHPHQVLLDPTGRFYIVPDLGSDEFLIIYSKDNDSFKLSSRVFVPPLGSGPRHGAFYPVGAANATHYFLLCELTNTIVVYSLIYKPHHLEFIRESKTSTFGAIDATPTTARAGHLELLPDNKHLYVSNRLTGQEHDSIAYMRIYIKQGHPTLEFVQQVSTLGILPRMFCVLDGGRGDILVANEKSESGLVLLERTPDGNIIETPKLCVPMSEFMGEDEMEQSPGNGPKFVMEL